MDYWIHVCLVPVTKYFGLDITADGYLHVFLPSFNYSESVSFGLVLSSFWDEISYTPGWPLNCGITGMTVNSWPSSVCLPCWDYRHHIHLMLRWGLEPRLSTLAARQAPVLQLSHSPCRPHTLSCFHAFSIGIAYLPWMCWDAPALSLLLGQCSHMVPLSLSFSQVSSLPPCSPTTQALVIFPLAKQHVVGFPRDSHWQWFSLLCIVLFPSEIIYRRYPFLHKALFRLAFGRELWQGSSPIFVCLIQPLCGFTGVSPLNMEV